MSLADKIRKARESTIEVGGQTYTISRPTDADVLVSQGADGLAVIKRHVIGWTHSALSLGIPGGDDAKIPFDQEAFGAWIDDQPELWGPLTDAIVSAYTAHAAKREDAEKK
jgi:hypothetical protein